MKLSFMKNNTESSFDGRRAGRAVVQLPAGLQRIGVVVVFVTAALAFALPCAHAAPSISPTDQDFILAAAQDSMTDVKLGRLAIRNAVREDVKAFGQTMVKDHTAINADLQVLATQKGLATTGSLDPKHQAVVDKLTALTGIKFDDAYIADMKRDHKKNAREFEAESEETKDAEIKSFVDNAIPLEKAHLNQITEMKEVAAAGVDPNR
jgi:putative membrane protein